MGPDTFSVFDVFSPVCEKAGSPSVYCSDNWGQREYTEIRNAHA